MEAPSNQEAAAPLSISARRRLSGPRPIAPGDRLRRLAELPEASLTEDRYGQGGAQSILEGEIAEKLGKPAAVFLPKGVIAQLAVLRMWSERTGRGAVAVHPLSHLEQDEGGALAALHPVRPVRVGPDSRPFTAADLEQAADRFAAVVVECPLRRAAFQLTPWEELVRISAWSRDHGAALHLDGARLWEAAAGFERPPAEIAALFDTVYVSFYKGLEGLGGAAVAGETQAIAELRPWLHRHGAHPFTAFPYTLAALDGLRRVLPKMPARRERAAALAAALRAAGFSTSPPQTNAFVVALPGGAEAVLKGVPRLARRRDVWLLDRVMDAGPGACLAEVQIGSAAEDLSNDEITALFAELVADIAGR